jgi:hypothetical protein
MIPTQQQHEKKDAAAAGTAALKACRRDNGRVLRRL